MAGFGEERIKKKQSSQSKTKKQLRATGETLHRIAITHHAQGDLINAEKNYREAIKTGYINYNVFVNLGVICKNSERSSEALILYKKAIEVSPDQPDAYYNLGNLYQILGNFQDAVKFSAKSLELNPNNAEAHITLGWSQKELGNLDQALASTLKSLELKSDNHTAHMNLGGIYKDLGNFDQAVSSMLKSLELKSDNPTAHMNLGIIYKDLGNLDQALTSTLKSLELNPNNPDALMNLGIIYKDLGNLDQALAYTLKSLELKPDNTTAHMNLGGINQDLGKFDQAILHFKEATKSSKTHEKASTQLAKTYYFIDNFVDGINAISGTHSEEAENIRLSMHLCLNNKNEFNTCANKLIKKGSLNQQGIAAIDHANILFNQTLDNGLGGSTLDSIYTQTISENELSDATVQQLLTKLTDESIQSRSQGLLVNGSQTSGNILDSPEKPFQELKALLIQKISGYNKSCHINTDKNFDTNWEKNLYLLRGWAIIMDTGGNLMSHNHEDGWLTGTFYLQMPDEGFNAEEGAIEFSHQGPKYPAGNVEFEKRLMRPLARDLNIFSSSLFHRTLPFQSTKQRICIAFDISQRSKC